jgi:hypothetical protein
LLIPRVFLMKSDLVIRLLICGLWASVFRRITEYARR